MAETVRVGDTGLVSGTWMSAAVVVHHIDSCEECEIMKGNKVLCSMIYIRFACVCERELCSWAAIVL